MKDLKDFLQEYLKERPLFLSLIRAKEADLYQRHLPLKRPVLDVGVGDGFFAKVTFGHESHPALDAGSQWIPGQARNDNNTIIDAGLDLPDSRIDEARKIGIYKKLIAYDDGKMPFPSRSFQTVVSNCVLEHIRSLEFTVGEIYRILRPGGMFLTTVMAKPWEENLFGTKILGDFYKKWMRKKQVHVNLLEKIAWEQMFTDQRFKIAKSIGYLSPNACKLIDISHYLSLPNLVSYKLFRKWVLFPELTKFIYPVNILEKILSEKVNPDRSGAIFYVLQKKMV